ncbi:MAG TPA: SPFH domain-containing protein [Terriglobales bacterium]|nr:SPFH domain-containing protein [Terriglobales bacterium]
MLALKYLLILSGISLIAIAVAYVIFNLHQLRDYRRRLAAVAPETPFHLPEPLLDWSRPRVMAIVAVIVLLIAPTIHVVPSGMGGVRVSQISGTCPGPLYPGVHFTKPLIETVVLYDMRDQVLTTSSSRETAKAPVDSKSVRAKEEQGEVFIVQAREGLPIGLAISVRYRLDPRRLDYIHANLPQPVEKEIVPPVVASVFREITPNFTMRELFSSRREEIRRTAAERITAKLATDGVIVKEVMLRDIQLPAEFAKGLEGLLLKEQENEGLRFVTEMKEKQVRIAELEAEAQQKREVKRAEGEARVRVLLAKGESDAMQYTLPLKEKQIQQSRLEAEARKETTVMNAEAMGRAKVIDSKAEMERRNLLADAEAKRIRVIASADSERMQSEAVLLKQNPLLINKIIAERLSDKLQMVMVPSNGKFFFNDVLKGNLENNMAAQAEDAEADDEGNGNGKMARQSNRPGGRR